MYSPLWNCFLRPHQQIINSGGGGSSSKVSDSGGAESAAGSSPFESHDDDDQFVVQGHTHLKSVPTALPTHIQRHKANSTTTSSPAAAGRPNHMNSPTSLRSLLRAAAGGGGGEPPPPAASPPPITTPTPSPTPTITVSSSHMSPVAANKTDNNSSDKSKEEEEEAANINININNKNKNKNMGVVSPAHSSLYTITSPASPFSLNVPLLASSSAYSSSSSSSSLFPGGGGRHHPSSLFLFGDLLFSASSSSPHISVSSHSSLSELHHRFRVGSAHVSVLIVSLDLVFTAHLDHQIRVWRRPITMEGGALLHSTASAKSHNIMRRSSAKKSGSSSYKLLGTLPSAKDFLINAIASEKNYVQIRRHYSRLWIQHVDTITSLVVEPDGSLLYSGSWDKTVKVWKLSKMKCIQSIKAHDDAVNAMMIGRENGILYTASADKTVKGWKKIGERRVLMWRIDEAHNAAVNAMVMSGDGSMVYTAGSDCKINVWRRRRKPAALLGGGARSTTTSNHHENSVSSSSSSNLSGPSELGGGGGARWRKWAELRGHRQAVLCLAAAGPLVCSGSADKTIRVWKREGDGNGDGQQQYMACMAVLEGHGGPVRSLTLKIASTRHCVVNSGAMDATVRSWSLLFFHPLTHTHKLTSSSSDVVT